MIKLFIHRGITIGFINLGGLEGFGNSGKGIGCYPIGESLINFRSESNVISTFTTPAYYFY